MKHDMLPRWRNALVRTCTYRVCARPEVEGRCRRSMSFLEFRGVK